MSMTPAFPAIPVPPVQAAPGTFSSPDTVIATGGQMVALAQDFMGRLESAAYFTAPTINTDLPTIPAAPAPVTAPMPTLADVTWVVPGSPADLSAVVPDVTQYLPGPFSGTLPGLVFGTMPIVDYGSAPDQPAIDLNFTYPTLNLNLPVAPSLMSVSVGLLGDVVLPTWTAEMPILLAMPPNIVGYAEGAIYTSTLLSSLSNDLNLAITTGQGLVVGGDIETVHDRHAARQFARAFDLDEMPAPTRPDLAIERHRHRGRVGERKAALAGLGEIGLFRASVAIDRETRLRRIEPENFGDFRLVEHRGAA